MTETIATDGRTAPKGFDVDAIRADFPIFARTIWDKPLVYLDSGASAQKPRQVIDAMVRTMEHSFANVHRGLHTLANEATEAFEGARQDVARLLGAKSEDEIVFTRGSTEAINIVANGLAGEIGEGDEIIVTQMEHHSNIVPWHFLRERKGAVLKWVPVLDDGSLDMEAYAELLSPRTKIVAATHMSNVLGTITDAAEIVRLAHEAGALCLLDGSQSVVHLPETDVQALDADFYVFTGHKLYGPTGAGALYAKKKMLKRMRPFMGGGEMIESVSEDSVTFADPPQKFEAGTPSIVDAIGLGAAIRYVETIDRQAAMDHETRLMHMAQDRLKKWNDVRILGEAPGKGAIVAFDVQGAHAHDIAQIMDRFGVAVRAGAHCAEPLMRRFDCHSSLRASFAMYNTEKDVETFLEAFEKARDILG